jgi:hypothetical protein
MSHTQPVGDIVMVREDGYPQLNYSSSTLVSRYLDGEGPPFRLSSSALGAPA